MTKQKKFILISSQSNTKVVLVPNPSNIAKIFFYGRRLQSSGITSIFTIVARDSANDPWFFSDDDG